jgi:hypothetical protein
MSNESTVKVALLNKSSDLQLTVKLVITWVVVCVYGSTGLVGDDILKFV